MRSPRRTRDRRCCSARHPLCHWAQARRIPTSRCSALTHMCVRGLQRRRRPKCRERRPCRLCAARHGARPTASVRCAPVVARAKLTRCPARLAGPDAGLSMSAPTPGTRKSNQPTAASVFAPPVDARTLRLLAAAIVSRVWPNAVPLRRSQVSQSSAGGAVSCSRCACSLCANAYADRHRAAVAPVSLNAARPANAPRGMHDFFVCCGLAASR